MGWDLSLLLLLGVLDVTIIIGYQSFDLPIVSLIIWCCLLAVAAANSDNEEEIVEFPTLKVYLLIATVTFSLEALPTLRYQAPYPNLQGHHRQVRGQEASAPRVW